MTALLMDREKDFPPTGRHDGTGTVPYNILDLASRLLSVFIRVHLWLHFNCIPPTPESSQPLNRLSPEAVRHL